MITQAQFDALGPVAQDIINTDRMLGNERRRAVVSLDAYRALAQDRRMLSAAAEILCRRPQGGSWGRSS